MSKEREVRKETDFWGNEKEVIYENNQRVGEIKTEERGGFLGLGGESVKVEYDSSGKEVSYIKNEERGGFLGIGAEPVEVRYDSSENKEVSYSKVEERGGIFGIGSHHVRVEYDKNDKEVSQTHHERRGDFLGVGGERVRVTQYTEKDKKLNKSTDTNSNTHYYTNSQNITRDTFSFSKLVITASILAVFIWTFSAISQCTEKQEHQLLQRKLEKEKRLIEEAKARKIIEKEKIEKLKEEERIKNLIDKSLKPTKVITAVTVPFWNSSRTYTLTDASIYGFYPTKSNSKGEEIPFLRIDYIETSVQGGRYSLYIIGPAENTLIPSSPLTYYMEYRREISFGKNKSNYEKFYSQFKKALADWRSKYSEIRNIPKRIYTPTKFH